MGAAPRFLTCVVVALAGCYSPSPPDGIACSDHGTCPEGQICVDAVCTYVSSLVWDPPVALHELDDPNGEQNQDPCLTEDRLTIVFASDRDGGNGGDDLWMATRSSPSEPFGDITNLSALNRDSNDNTPEISADGTTILFTSDRNGDDDIWTSTKDSFGSWQDPTRVDELSRANHDDSEVALTPDGLLVFLVRDNMFYQATRASTSDAFGQLSPIPELAITDDAASPTLGDHANVVYFHAGQPRELYVSRLQPDGSYSMPEPVHELDTPDRNADPFITGDERHMVFNRMNSIYETQRSN